MRKAARPRLGCRGPSFYASKTPLALARMLVKVEHQVGRLKSERDGRTWSDPVQIEPKNMKKIRGGQADRQARRLAALDDVLDDMAEAREGEDLVGRHLIIADRVAKKLNEPFPWRTLYRQPYLSRWQKVDDFLGRLDTDVAVGIRDRIRWKKPRLVWALRRLTLERNGLLEERRAALLADPDAQGWEPIRKG